MKITRLFYRLRPICDNRWFDAATKLIYMLLPVFLVSSMLFSEGFAANKTFTGPGNFSNAAKWNGSTLPVAGDNMTINGTCTIDNNAGTDNVVYGNLVIGGTITGVLNWVAGGTNTLNVFDVNGYIPGSSLNMTNGGSLISRGSITEDNFSFTCGTGTIERRLPMTTTLAWTFNNLRINGSGTIIVGIDLIVTGNLTLNTGTLSIGGFNLAVSGTTTVSGTLTITGTAGTKVFGDLIINGTFNNTANEAITVNGDFQNNGTYNSGTGILTFSGAASNTISGTAATTTFGGRIVVNKGASNANILEVQSVITMPAGGLTLTNGTFKLSSNSTIIPFTADITTAPYLIPGTAGLWVNGGTVSTSVNITAAGLVRVSNGTFNVGDAADESLLTAWATTLIEGGVFNVAGRFMRRVASEGAYFSMTGGTLTVADIGSTSATISPFTLDNSGSSFTMSGGTIIIERAGSSNLGYVNLAGTSNVTGGTLQIGNALTPVTQTMLINSSVPIGNLSINATNSPTGQLITNSLTVVSNVTISGGTLNSSNLNFTVGGNWTKEIASSYTQGTGTVTFNGTGAQSINGTSASQTFNHVVVAKTAGTTLSVLASTTSMGTQNLTQTTGNFTAPATLNINGNLLISAGTFTAGTTTNILGNWTKNGGTFIPGTYVVNFTGAATKTLGGTSVNSFYNLTLNTVASTDIVQLTNNATVTNVLNLTMGVFDLNSRTLFITNSSNAAITRTSGYILSEKTDNSSKVSWTVNNSAGIHTYPFGTVAGAYIPFMLTRTDGNLGAVTASTYPTAVNNTPYPTTPDAVTNMFGSLGTDNSANVVDRFWQIDKVGAIAQATFTFTATPAEIGTIMLPTAQRYESTTNKWQAPLPGQTSTATSATVAGVTTFSPWTLSSQAALLPIQLVSFNAVYADPLVSLTWVTESEVNSDHFTIERTRDERSFETVSQVKAAGESIQTLNYQTTDKNPLSGLSYYRLKQVDRDGTVSYSDLVAIQAATTNQISISPNPVIDGITTIRMQNHEGETIHISVMDLNGKILFVSTNTLGDAAESSIVIDRLDNLPKGMYIIRLSGAKDIFNQKIAIY